MATRKNDAAREEKEQGCPRTWLPKRTLSPKKRKDKQLMRKERESGLPGKIKMLKLKMTVKNLLKLENLAEGLLVEDRCPI